VNEFTNIFENLENYGNMGNSTFSKRATSLKILEFSDIQETYALSQKVD
jgi:hypothetical protein